MQQPGSFISPDDNLHPGSLLYMNKRISVFNRLNRTKHVLKLSGCYIPLHKLTGLLIIFLLCCLPEAPSQQEINYEVHANIIYHFTKYIDWPDQKKTGDFIIGIIGDSPLYEELEKIASNKTVGNQKIVIKKFSSSETVFTCHILFICQGKSRILKNIVAATKNSSTLIVSESDGLVGKGSCINFVIVHEHLKLEMSKNNIEQRGLSIATELLNLGINVK